MHLRVLLSSGDWRVLLDRTAHPDGRHHGQPGQQLGDRHRFRLGKETFEHVVLERPEIANELSETLASRRVNLIAVRDGLDADARLSRHTSERDRILQGIKGFFGL